MLVPSNTYFAVMQLAHVLGTCDCTDDLRVFWVPDDLWSGLIPLTPDWATLVIAMVRQMPRDVHFQTYGGSVGFGTIPPMDHLSLESAVIDHMRRLLPTPDAEVRVEIVLRTDDLTCIYAASDPRTLMTPREIEAVRPDLKS
jgi:hypothetical protein